MQAIVFPPYENCEPKPLSDTQKKILELKQKRNFAFPFRTPTGLREEVEHYIDALKEKGTFSAFRDKRNKSKKQ